MVYPILMRNVCNGKNKDTQDITYGKNGQSVLVIHSNILVIYVI